MLDDPLGLIVQGIFLLAAGMYPVGFLFGACSGCCCVCGVAGTDLADWCCDGTHPEEITVRISNGTENQTIGEGCYYPCETEISGDLELNCASFNGDYVLARQGCGYVYSPGPECDEEEEYECPDPPGEVFFAGPYISISVCDGDQDSVPGPGYDIAVFIRGLCEATWDGKPTLYGVRAGGCGAVGMSHPFRQLFEEPNCALQGVSGTIREEGPFGLGRFGDLYFPAEVSSETSCDTCNSVVLGSCDGFWYLTEDYCESGGRYTCSWDIEILPL
jgi:hypothetical protein